MRIHPLLKWFGSKWSATKSGKYPAPEHNQIFEPFAGGAGYALNYCDRQVTIYDRDPLLQVLWRWMIQKATSEQVLAIPVGLPVGTDITSLPDLSIGQALLLKHWQRTNNVGDCFTISPWGASPGQWTANTRARVAEEIHAIKHWKVEECQWDQPGTYFVDPPYQYNYQYRLKGFDYDKLKKQVDCLPSTSQIIACEAACPKTGSVPNYLPFVESHSQVTSRRKTANNHHSRELIYVRSGKEVTQ